MLRRVDAENRLQTLKEELDFQKNIYSEVSTTLMGLRADERQLDIELGVRGHLYAKHTSLKPCTHGVHPAPRLMEGCPWPVGLRQDREPGLLGLSF